MAVGVVEFLEVVDIGHGDHIVAPQALHALVQRTAPRQAGQLVAESHLVGLVRHRCGDHQHYLAAHDVQGERQDEGLRQHPEDAQQAHHLRCVQRPWRTQVLHHQQDEHAEEQRVDHLDQAHPLAMQGWPADFRQPGQQRFGVALLKGHCHAAHGKQHGATGDQVLQQVGALLPGTIQPEQGGQQQAHQVEDHRRVLAHAAMVTVEVGLGVEQVVGDVHREHQEQLALATVHRTVGAAQQQDQGGQDVEQRCEKDTEVSHIGRGEACQQKNQRRQEVACAYSV
ncbi:hypothetical protein D3C78_1245590 [compost metagenome]